MTQLTIEIKTKTEDIMKRTFKNESLTYSSKHLQNT